MIRETDSIRDLGVTAVLRDILPESSVPIFELLTLFGDLWLILPVVGIVCFMDIYRGAPNGERGTLCTSRTGYFVGVVFGGLALAVVLKSVFALPRPPMALQATPRGGFGFPSGHTLAATILWGALTTWSQAGTHRMRMLVAGSLIGLVAFSRLALGVHYFVDVVASIGFGVGYLVLAAWLTDRDPVLMFGGAIGIGVVAFLVDGTGQDGQLALVGTIGAAVGWWMLKRLDNQTGIHNHTS